MENYTVLELSNEDSIMVGTLINADGDLKPRIKTMIKEVYGDGTIVFGQDSEYLDSGFGEELVFDVQIIDEESGIADNLVLTIMKTKTF